MPRILCVEDDADSCEMLSMLLGHENDSYQVLSATSGARAIEMIEAKKFDGYVLDLVLPDIDGVELCRYIRETDMRVPIIFYTGRIDSGARLSAIDAGATEFLAKPNDIDRIGDVLSKLLDFSTV